MRTQSDVKSILRVAFRDKFPTDTVDIENGYQENIHVLIVSRLFDYLNDKERNDYLWHIMDGTDLSDDEKKLVSLTMAVSPAEIK